jgi:hypothetical protein
MKIHATDEQSHDVPGSAKESYQYEPHLKKGANELDGHVGVPWVVGCCETQIDDTTAGDNAGVVQSVLDLDHCNENLPEEKQPITTQSLQQRL